MLGIMPREFVAMERAVGIMVFTAASHKKLGDVSGFFKFGDGSRKRTVP